MTDCRHEFIYQDLGEVLIEGNSHNIKLQETNNILEIEFNIEYLIRHYVDGCSGHSCGCDPF